MLGAMKILLALLFGSSLLQLLQHLPGPLLGSMLLMSGLELAASARKEKDARGYCFMLLTAVAILGLGNTALGFVVGLGGYAAVVVYEWCARKVGAWVCVQRSRLNGTSTEGSGTVKYSQLEVCNAP